MPSCGLERLVALLLGRLEKSADQPFQSSCVYFKLARLDSGGTASVESQGL